MSKSSEEYSEREMAWRSLPSGMKKRITDARDYSTIIDGRTYDRNGEDITYLVQLEEQTKPITERQQWARRIHSDMSVHSDENGGFVLAFFETLRTNAERFHSLTQPDLARLMFIGTFTAWETGRLQSGKYFISRSELAEILGMSRSRFSEFYGRLLDEGILREDAATGELFMNPTVFYRGELTAHPCDLTDYRHSRVFRKTVRELYSAYRGRKLNQLAILYSILPYLNFHTNIVCHNPDESDPKLLRPMSNIELAELLGYANPQKLTTALRSVQLDGKPVFTMANNPRNWREKRIVVNPRVVYAGNGDELKWLMVLFN